MLFELSVFPLCQASIVRITLAAPVLVVVNAVLVFEYEQSLCAAYDSMINDGHFIGI